LGEVSVAVDAASQSGGFYDSGTVCVPTYLFCKNLHIRGAFHIYDNRPACFYSKMKDSSSKRTYVSLPEKICKPKSAHPGRQIIEFLRYYDVVEPGSTTKIGAQRKGLKSILKDR
jgi:hypothetical protein